MVLFRSNFPQEVKYRSIYSKYFKECHFVITICQALKTSTKQSCMLRKNNIHMILTWEIYSDQDDNTYIHVNAFRGKKKMKYNCI